MDIFRVTSPGSFTTVQDRGRYSFIDRGVPPSGTLDLFAARIANLLVGNPAGAAVLETTMTGPVLEFLDEVDIAITGADMASTVNREPVPVWRSIRVKEGDVIRLRQAKSGCRAYLAVTGGIDVPVVMGSRATCIQAKIGGLEGRPLKKGDVLARLPGAFLAKPRRLPVEFIPAYSPDVVVRAVAGPQDEAFASGLETFFSSVYEVTPEADRMGYRLKGTPVYHDKGFPRSIISEPTVPGNVQLPADGQPIILLVEQTTGGYTKIATVISTDLSKIAQAMPGNRLRFQQVTLEEAHGIYREQAVLLKQIETLLSSAR
ncbi:MAG TPA: biotin-dependent carboxyltransferase family protein [Syntrophales bacterium]|nr:biotin-dependent carboxyltransferase family protein [Syntrophales bacterium]